MKLPTELLLLALTHLASCATLRPRSANFASVRGLTSLSTDHSSNNDVLRPEKYFHESTFHSHYDGRFAEAQLPPQTRAFHLRLLLRSYMDTMDIIGIRTWIMHGCLLGWWWNGKILPWDSDVDVMVDERSMAELGNWWNMTVHHYTAKDLGISAKDMEKPKIPHSVEDQKAHLRKLYLEKEVLRKGKKYLLEVNPHYTNTSTTDRHNVIDARWIDTATGLYIDITTIHVAPTPPDPRDPSSPSSNVEDEDILMFTKDQHAYSHYQIFPLRRSTFESIPVRIPYAYESLLAEEYGLESLTDTWYNGYGFDPDTHEWVIAEPTEQQSKELADREAMKPKPKPKPKERPKPEPKPSPKLATGTVVAEAPHSTGEGVHGDKAGQLGDGRWPPGPGATTKA
ncbi:uncharacterized protein K460DRAFT_386597 [Cucurbitaria berberidis CBS 394.84]|uniref:LicD/FKTN/FKRP nucleotidyltransferase domain-containing protein n=1 Tax=Cucurbitaria berberidis CBS 394.84 TaxID=1168544 RepID=A0A9P4GIL2_9PLEO|nr:uncharacterized protein K460DRAFT_386597 [Cucurbitaria berberidis CBS 394.84]KAF1846317.1 hypothetical protein K460DRAFT_386597 [Cucurbitaria berberidis CBS 394.84]